MENHLETQRNRGRLLRSSIKFATIAYFTLLAACVVYLFGFTADRYVSTAEFRISENKDSAADAGLLALALPGLVDSRSLDSQITLSYVASADLLMQVENKFDLRGHYSSPKTDFYFRMAKDSNLEQRLEYYRKRITSHFNQETGLTVISVETFEPEFSKQVAGFLLEKSEEFVNQVNQKIADRQFDFLHKEFERAAENLEKANRELNEFQDKHAFISPEQMIASTLTAVESMKLEMLKNQAEIATLVRDSPNSPRIELLESQLRSLSELMSVEQSKLSGPEKNRLNKIAKEFQLIESRIEFRSRLLSGAELLLEKNRSEAITNSKFFTVIQTPFLPEDALFPRRAYSSITIVIIGVLIFIILRILVQSVVDRV